MESTSDSVPDPDKNPIKSVDDDEMYLLLELFHSYHDDDISDVDIHMLKAWLVISTSSKSYTVSTMLFYKHVGDNVWVKNPISLFSMYVPTKANVKLANGNKGMAQVAVIILCNCTNFPIIYPLGSVY